MFNNKVKYLIIIINIVIFLFFISPSIGWAVYECGGVTDDCNCGVSNDFPCCSNGGNCTWWAWHKVCCNWGHDAAYDITQWIRPRDAHTWDDQAENSSIFSVSNIPTPNTIAVREAHSDNYYYGHVAWVESVNGSDVTVTEMMCCPSCFYGYRTRTYSASHFDGGYIYLSTSNRLPEGYLDEANCESFAGWARDPDTTASIRVDFYADGPAGTGNFVGNTWANIYRPDLPFSDKYHGFNFPTPESLKDGNSHAIYAYAIDSEGGTNPLLNNSPKTITCGSTPSPPTNVQATDGTYTDKVRITWSASSGATSYEVYRAISSGGTKNKIGTPSGTSYDDYSASVGTTYYYWVKAKNSYGTSGYSSYNTGYRAGTPPPAPTNVQATDGTYTDKVRITWSASSGATSYEVYRAISSGGTKNKIGTPSGTSYDDYSASVGTTYYYWVKAKNSYGTSGYSSYNTGYRAGTAPPAPTNVQATDGTYTDKVRITWSASSGATSYEVYRAISSGGTKNKIGTPSGTSYDDYSASVGTTYYYWVKAKNSYGTSGYSSYNTGYRAGTAPPAPTNVQATDGTYTDKVRITWSASSGATSYEVYRATSSGGTKSKIGTPSGTSYDDYSASVGTTYYYWVKAKNSYGTSGYSSYNTGYRAGTAPPAPTNVQATDGTYTDKVRITWSASSGATSYEVYRATSSGGTKSKIGTPSGTSYDDYSASVGTTYYYWVKAKNSYGTSGYSSYNTGYRAGTAPPAPTNVQATDGTYTDKVRITWSASSGATSYEVYRATSSGGTKSKIGTPSGTSYDDTSASVGTTYYYWVKAKNSYGTSGYSSYNTGYRAGEGGKAMPWLDLLLLDD